MVILPSWSRSAALLPNWMGERADVLHDRLDCVAGTDHGGPGSSGADHRARFERPSRGEVLHEIAQVVLHVRRSGRRDRLPVPDRGDTDGLQAPVTEFVP